tara:strand:+ start:1610 stop:1804 length:195 start_codon:yes stop_codon:yes gene_type:complete
VAVAGRQTDPQDEEFAIKCCEAIAGRIQTDVLIELIRQCGASVRSKEFEQKPELVVAYINSLYC